MGSTQELFDEIKLKLPPAQKFKAEKFSRYACVAVILRGERCEDLEAGFIRRAIHDQDRWSGQIAFPGGKAEPEDLTDLDTALRETKEEIGMELSPQELVGQLNDIQARKMGQMLDFFIRPFVFYRANDFATVLDPREVADFFWISLKDLRDEKKQVQFELSREQASMKLPAIQMASDPPLWGLTYMMTAELLAKIK